MVFAVWRAMVAGVKLSGPSGRADGAQGVCDDTPVNEVVIRLDNGSLDRSRKLGCPL